MEFNRNQWFLAGIVVLLLGLQLRYVTTFVLNERTTQFLAQRLKDAEMIASNDPETAMAASAPIAKKAITPPPWVGYMLVSVGSVLLLYSLAMKRPGT
jgi:hypothetical protein